MSIKHRNCLHSAKLCQCTNALITLNLCQLFVGVCEKLAWRNGTEKNRFSPI